MVSRLLAYLHVSEEAVFPKVLLKGLAGLTTNEALAHVVFLDELFVLTQVDELINDDACQDLHDKDENNNVE